VVLFSLSRKMTSWDFKRKAPWEVTSIYIPPKEGRRARHMLWVCNNNNNNNNNNNKNKKLSKSTVAIEGTQKDCGTSNFVMIPLLCITSNYPSLTLQFGLT
jgi:hypothetical protein